MKIISSDLTDFNFSLQPWGCCKQNGALDEKRFHDKIKTQFNYGADGIRLSVVGWVEKGNRFDINAMPFKYFDSNKKYDLQHFNSTWQKNIINVFEIVKTFNRHGKPILILSLFMKYDYDTPWNNNSNGINGWYDKEAWGYVQSYINFILAKAKHYSQWVDIYIEPVNEPALHQVEAYRKIFNYILGKGWPLKKITLGFQYRTKNKNSTELVGTEFNHKFRKPLSDKEWDLIKDNCGLTIHQFIKNDISKILQIESNIPADSQHWYWSTDGDKPRPHFDTLYNAFYPLWKSTKIYSKMFANSFVEGFTYQNDLCIYNLDSVHYQAIKKHFKNNGKYKDKEWVDPQPQPDPEPESEPGSAAETPEEDNTMKWYQKIFAWLKNFWNKYPKFRSYLIGLISFEPLRLLITWLFEKVL